MFLFLGAQGWIAVPLLLLLGFSAVAVMPVSMALVQESFPQDRALANGIYMAINFLVQALGVLLLGALADRLGLRTAFTISAAVILLGLPIILLLPKRGTPRSRDTPGARHKPTWPNLHHKAVTKTQNRLLAAS